jgi:SAM-dependent methyltransferase
MDAAPTASPETRLRPALRELYGDGRFVPRVWTDTSDHAFLGITLIERSVALLAGRLGGELLDVGCGRQPYAGYLSHVARKRTCDFDSARGQVDFECPADKIPLPDGSLDSIFCTEVLEHTPEPAAVWREFSRVLRPGGRVLLATPMYWPGHEEPYDFFRYTYYGLRHLAESAGFEVETIVPRGGTWAFFGQAIIHSIPQYLPFRWQRRLINWASLKLDAWRANPRITIGWTILARKRAVT